MNLNKIQAWSNTLKCVFCEIIQGKSPASFLYQDDDVVAFMDKYPIDTGHSLVVTRRHYEKITDMVASDVGVLFSRVPDIARAVMAGAGADAFSIAQNNGRAAKQIVPHVHIHIIPRFSHRGTVWTKREISNAEQLESLAEKIRAQL